MVRRTCVSLLPLLLGACALTNGVDILDDRSPPPELGRPGWVRGCAAVGAWIGGIGGGVVSIVLLPVTLPISWLADDGLGEHASGEFVLFPALTGAAIGHSLLGTPPDVLDFVFRRAWVDGDDPVTSYEYVPLPGPLVPQAAPPAAPSPQPTPEASPR